MNQNKKPNLLTLILIIAVAIILLPLIWKIFKGALKIAFTLLILCAAFYGIYAFAQTTKK